MEGLGKRIVDVYAAKHGSSAVPECPHGAAFLYVELAGEDAAALAATAAAVVDAAGASAHRHVTDPDERAAVLASRATQNPQLLASSAPNGPVLHFFRVQPE